MPVLKEVVFFSRVQVGGRDSLFEGVAESKEEYVSKQYHSCGDPCIRSTDVDFCSLLQGATKVFLNTHKYSNCSSFIYFFIYAQINMREFLYP